MRNCLKALLFIFLLCGCTDRDPKKGGHVTKLNYYDNGKTKSKVDYYRDSVTSIFYGPDGEIDKKVIEMYLPEESVLKKVFLKSGMDSLIQLVKLNDGLYHENQKLIIRDGTPLKSSNFFKLIQADTVFDDNLSHYFIEYYVPKRSDLIDRIITLDLFEKSRDNQRIVEKMSPIIKDSIKYVFHIQTDTSMKKGSIKAVIDDQIYISENDSVRIFNKKMFVQERYSIDSLLRNTKN